MEGIVEKDLEVIDVCWRVSMGKQYAFVTTVQLDDKGARISPPPIEVKKWVEVDITLPDTLRRVIKMGGSWANMP
ncbi:MAG: hypothetical protein P1U35_04230 [Cycloclasticus sp.]|nr:hypothetical protein [Cycloclasticus sp.]